MPANYLPNRVVVASHPQHSDCTSQSRFNRFPRPHNRFGTEYATMFATIGGNVPMGKRAMVKGGKLRWVASKKGQGEEAAEIPVEEPAPKQELKEEKEHVKLHAGISAFELHHLVGKSEASAERAITPTDMVPAGIVTLGGLAFPKTEGNVVAKEPRTRENRRKRRDPQLDPDVISRIPGIDYQATGIILHAMKLVPGSPSSAPAEKLEVKQEGQPEWSHLVHIDGSCGPLVAKLREQEEKKYDLITGEPLTPDKVKNRSPIYVGSRAVIPTNKKLEESFARDKTKGFNILSWE